MRSPANTRHNKPAAIHTECNNGNPRYSTHWNSCCIIYAKI